MSPIVGEIWRWQREVGRRDRSLNVDGRRGTSTFVRGSETTVNAIVRSLGNSDDRVSRLDLGLFDEVRGQLTNGQGEKVFVAVGL
jgi:hypothetical protein